MRPDPLNRRPAPAASRLLVALIGLLVCIPPVAQVFMPARRIIAPTSVSESIPSGYGIWLKADSVVPDPSGNLTNWADSSGNNYFADLGGAASPPYVGTNIINGYNVFYNDTEGKGLRWTNSAARDIFKDTEAATVFLVAYPVSDAFNPIIDVSQGDATFPSRFAVRYNTADSNGFTITGSRLDSEGDNNCGLGTLPIDNWYIVEALPIWTNNTARLITNGVPMVASTAWNAAAGNTENTTPANMWLGSYAQQVGETWLGYIAEVIIYPDLLTSADRDTVRDYLSAKFGITVASSDFTPETAVFDGSNDYMTMTSSGPAGLADGNKFTFSTWVKFSDDGTFGVILSFGTSAPAQRFLIRRNDDNTIFVFAADSGGTEILRIASTATFTVADGWTHLYVCIDLSDTAKRKIYKNGTASGLTVTTYNTSGTIDFAGVSYLYQVGATVTAGDKLNAALLEPWFYGAYLDDTTKFASAGCPISLGSDGSIPTGISPSFFFRGSGNGFNVNSGIGGQFTIVGSLGTTTTPCP